MDIQSRLRQYLEVKGLTNKEFEKLCALGNGTAARIGENSRKTILDRISNNCDLNTNWLLTGEGEMLRNPDLRNEVDDLTPEEDAAVRADIAAGRITLVPLIPLGAHAGSFSDYLPEGIDASRCERVPCPVPGCDLAIDVTGDSMEPDFPNGCRVFVRRINDSAFIAWGNVFVLDTCNGAFIKRIMPSPTDPDTIEARSINPDYPPFTIPKDSIYGMYRVILMARSYSAS